MEETRSEKTIIRWLAEALVAIVPEDYTTQQRRYWSDGSRHWVLQQQVKSILTSVCTSEWWQMLAAARVLIEPRNNRDVNERRYPLGKKNADSIKVRICRLGKWANSTQHAAKILAKRGLRPATLRETLEFLVKKKRQHWGLIGLWNCIIILQTPVTQDNHRKYRCLDVRIIDTQDRSEAIDGELFQLSERHTHPMDGQLEPRRWISVVNL